MTHIFDCTKITDDKIIIDSYKPFWEVNPFMSWTIDIDS